MAGALGEITPVERHFPQTAVNRDGQMIEHWLPLMR